MDGDWRMGEDMDFVVRADATTADAAKAIGERRGISGHRIQIRYPNGKLVPSNREDWTLKRLGVKDGFVLQVEPTLSGLWYWNTLEYYHEKLIEEIVTILKGSPDNMIKLNELAGQVRVPPPIKFSLQAFLRQYPDRISMHYELTNQQMWVYLPKYELQLPTVSDNPIALEFKNIPTYEESYFDWEGNYDWDDTKPATLAFDIPEKEYQIAILSAADLKRADLFGSSDPMGVVFFNDVEIGRTSSKKNTLNPVWRDAIFIFSIPATSEVADSELRVELWDVDIDSDGKEDFGDFLGCVVLKRDDLGDLMTAGRAVTKEFPLEQRLEATADDPEQDQSDITGTITLRGGVQGYEVCLVSARNLLNLNDPKSRPFATIVWNNLELSRTLPDRKNAKQPQFLETTAIPRVRHGQTMEEQVLEIHVWGTATHAKAQEGDKGQFLGAAILTGPELVNFFSANPPWGNNLRVPLRPTKSRLVGREWRKKEYTGFLNIIGGSTGLPIRPGKQVEFFVSWGMSLAKVPAIIYTVDWNYTTVFVSGPIAMGKKINHVGKEVSFFDMKTAGSVVVETEQGSTDCFTSHLRVDVYEYIKTGELEKTEYLGNYILTETALSELMDQKYASTKIIDLQRDDLIPMDRQKMVRGTLELRGGRSGARKETERVIEINSAVKLARANLFGSSDPFVVITWNGEQVGQTPTKSGTLNPTWSKQILYLECPTEKTKQNKDADGTSAGCTLSFEIFDETNDGKRGTFLGGVYLSKQELTDFLENEEPAIKTYPLTDAKKIKGAKVAPESAITLFSLGIGYVSIQEYQEFLEAKAKAEAEAREEERKAREAEELQRQEAEYYANIEREKQEAIAAEIAAQEAAKAAEAEAAVVAALRDLQARKEKKERELAAAAANEE